MAKPRQTAWKNRIVGYDVKPASWFIANEHNWRIHPKDQQEGMRGALDSVGWVQDVIVNLRTSEEWGADQNVQTLVDGHLRVTLALRAGEDTPVPVKYVDLSPSEEAQVLATLDPIAAMAATDKTKLDELMRAIQSDDERVQTMLAEIAEREGLEYGKVEAAREMGEDNPPDPDRAAEYQAKWNTAPGQVWQLGMHRLVIGDCTDAATVARLMQGEKARLIVTSPPYSNQRDYEIGPSFDWQALARGFSDCAFSVLDNPGDMLVNLGLEYKDGRVNAYWDEWLAYCSSIGHALYGWYVWDKGSGFPGEWNGRLAPAHEWVFHFSNGRKSANKWIPTTGAAAKRGTSGKRFRQKDGSLHEVSSPDKYGQPFKIPDSVIRIGRELKRGIHTQVHPAVFSVEFAEFFLNTWSDQGSVVYDPFLGSGTTLIACERLGRRGRGIEISPTYAAAALERWATMTGQMPVLVN